MGERIGACANRICCRIGERAWRPFRVWRCPLQRDRDGDGLPLVPLLRSEKPIAIGDDYCVHDPPHEAGSSGVVQVSAVVAKGGVGLRVADVCSSFRGGGLGCLNTDVDSRRLVDRGSRAGAAVVVGAWVGEGVCWWR